MGSKNKSTDLSKMTPTEIRERGRELLRLAQQKETEIKQRQLLAIGGIFQREIQSGWRSDWPTLSAELEKIQGTKIEPPLWGFVAGVQGGGQAPLPSAEEVEDE